jgi:hypothetical protein
VVLVVVVLEVVTMLHTKVVMAHLVRVIGVVLDLDLQRRGLNVSVEVVVVREDVACMPRLTELGIRVMEDQGSHQQFQEHLHIMVPVVVVAETQKLLIWALEVSVVVVMVVMVLA